MWRGAEARFGYGTRRRIVYITKIHSNSLLLNLVWSCLKDVEKSFSSIIFFFQFINEPACVNRFRHPRMDCHIKSVLQSKCLYVFFFLILFFSKRSIKVQN